MTTRQRLVLLCSLALLGAAAATLGVPAARGPDAAAQPALREAYQLIDTWDGRLGQGAPGSLLDPAGLDVGATHVYVADRGNHRVSKFAPDGAFIAVWGGRGERAGQLERPQDVAVDDGRVYVTDHGNARVSVFDVDGTALAQWPSADLAPALGAPWGVGARAGRVFITYPDDGTVLAVEGGQIVARRDGLPEPRGVAFGGPSGRVYVADPRAGEVHVLTRELQPVDSVRVNANHPPRDVAIDAFGELLVQSETATLVYPEPDAPGSRLGLFYLDIQGVAVRPDHGIYVTVASNARRLHGVLRYPWRPREGLPVAEWSLLDYPLGRLNAPHAVVADPEDGLWLADAWPRLQRFQPDGGAAAQLSPPGLRVPVDIVPTAAGEVIVGERQRMGRIMADGTLSQTVRLAQGTTDFWLTALAPGGTERVRMLDSSWMQVRTYGFTETLQPAGSWPLDGVDSPRGWELYWDLAPDADGRWYAVNRTTHEVEVYRNQALVDRWPTDGIPTRAAVGPDGHVFVLTVEGLVWKHTPSGEPVAGWDAAAFSAGASEVVDLAVTADGRVYTVDRAAETVRVWAPDPDAEPKPPQSRSGACRLRGDKRAAPSSLRRGGEVTVTLSIGGECPNTAPRADIMLAIDTSFSMNSDSKITDTIAAALQFIDTVDLTRDRVGITRFDNDAQLVQPLTADAEAAKAAVRGLTAIGGTNIAAALRVSAAELFGDNRREDVQPVIILLTDGRDPEPEDVLDEAQAAKTRGARVFAIGFGAVDHMVMTLSSSSPEDYYYAPDTSTLTAVYAEIARRITADVLARQLTIVDELPENMTYGGMVDGPAPRITGRTLRWTLTDVPLGGLSLRYRVQPTEIGRWPTNVQAEAEYTDGLDHDGRLTFPVPEVQVLARNPTVTPTSTPFPTRTPRPTATPIPRPVFLPLALRQRCTDRVIHADVVLVTDTSGSMREPSSTGDGTKLDDAVAAARRFVERLALPNDRAAIVSFNREATLVQPLTGERQLLLDQLDALETESGTRIDRGLEVAVAELTGERSDPARTRAIVLLTDGRSSVDDETVLAAADAAKDIGLLIFTIGLGSPEEVDFELLQQLSSGDGFAYQAPTGADLDAIYAQIAFTIECANLRWP